MDGQGEEVAPGSSGLRGHLPSRTFVVVAVIVLAALAAAFVYGGVYNIGADAPHSRVTYSVLQELRDRSIARQSRGIAVPRDVVDPRRIAAGAGLYAEMCVGCHLGPGVERTEISQGLYPPAPELARMTDRSAAEQFWTIKHGVKLSAMPAWGKTHSDELIWDMVAFIRQLPKMTPEQYKATVAAAPENHEEMMKSGHTEEGPATASPHRHAHAHSETD